MKIPGLVLLMGLANLAVCDDDERHALFVHTDSLDPLDPVAQYSDELDDAESRQIRQTEYTVRSILEWLQGRYTQPSRKIQRSSNRQEASPSQPSRQYLPVPEQPVKDRPRPFQPRPTQPPATFPSETPSATYIPAQPSQPPSSYPTNPSSPYPSPPTSHPGYPQPQPPHPPFPSVHPGTEFPPSTLLPPGEGPYTRPPSPSPPFTISPPSTYPPSPQTYPTGPTGPGTYPGTYPSSTPGTYPSSTPGTYPSSTPGTYPSSTPGTYYTSTSTGIPSDISEGGDEQVVIGTGSNEVDGNHPPHIHAINVECAKDMMTINLEFSRAFDGVIYSKGFYKDDSCRYVNPNSGQTHFSFTVRLNSCGTQFIDQFKEGGQAYLENVLVIQNEPGIQEVWDAIRRVRCLWEGNIKESLSVQLAIGMLSSEINTFSGDTAIAHLDIQQGRGPFAPAANGVVKIGETMTLVVSVEGDPGFDVQVRECVARDSTSINVVRLTDEQGCILRPKLIGAFQKTRDTGASGASIIAYAFFQAFKFPDVMDLTLECNVELCKTDCEACPLPGQNIDPGKRRRRDIWGTRNNSSLSDPVRVVRTFRVITPDDLEDAVGTATIVNVGSEVEGVCMSLPGFLLAVVFLLSILVGSCLCCTYFWLKLQRNSKVTKLANTVHLETFPISKA